MMANINLTWQTVLFGLLGAAILVALGFVIITRVIVALKKRRQQFWAREVEHRQRWHTRRQKWLRERLPDSLESLDLAMTELLNAAAQTDFDAPGEDEFKQVRAVKVAQARRAANRSGDDELRQLVGVVITRCDALVAAKRDRLDRTTDPVIITEFEDLTLALNESQAAVYRRIETLLAQAFD